MHFTHMSVIHFLKAMGPRNTLVIRYWCDGLKKSRQEFCPRSGLKLDPDLTPSHIRKVLCVNVEPIKIKQIQDNLKIPLPTIHTTSWSWGECERVHEGGKLDISMASLMGFFTLGWKLTLTTALAGLLTVLLVVITWNSLLKIILKD